MTLIFKKVNKTALAAKQFFDKIRLKAFPKTSGKTGLHLDIPGEGFAFPEARSIAINICKQIQKLVPDISTKKIQFQKEEISYLLIIIKTKKLIQ